MNRIHFYIHKYHSFRVKTSHYVNHYFIRPYFSSDKLREYLLTLMCIVLLIYFIIEILYKMQNNLPLHVNTTREYSNTPRKLNKGGDNENNNNYFNGGDNNTAITVHIFKPTAIKAYVIKPSAISLYIPINLALLVYSYIKKTPNFMCYDLSILKKLGLNINNIIIHKKIYDKPISWTYGDMSYYNLGNINSVLITDVNKYMYKSIKPNIVYALLLVLVNKNTGAANTDIITLSEQIIISINIKPEELYNWVESNKKKIHMEYGTDDGEYDLIVKTRIISYNETASKRIVSIPNIPDINKIVNIKPYIEDNIPLSFNLNDYGVKLNNLDVNLLPIITPLHNLINSILLNEEGDVYLYKDIVLLIKNLDEFKREITIYKNNAKYMSCVDTLNQDNNIISRVYYNNLTLFIDDKLNKLLYIEKVVNCKPINNSNKLDVLLDDKISTFDIECYLNINNIFIPYACGFCKYNGDIKTYYVTDYKNVEDMLINSILDMLKANLGTVYVHNLSKFDSLFINDILLSNKLFKSSYVLNKNGKILKIVVKLADSSNKLKLILRDSLLILPGSLRSITKSFTTDNTKTYFPYSFVNKNNLNYIGDIPNIKFWDGIPLKVYNDLPKLYNLREECIKYLINDLLSLKEVVTKFAIDIYDAETINITNTPTISSIAFKALTTNYTDNDILYQIKGRSYENMRLAFFGGITEVYNLLADKGVNIYDINSSYPASMKLPMPVGKPTFTTNPKGLDYYFGVVFAKITTPIDSNGNFININYPPIPLRLEDGSIINPIGSWSGLYCSELLKFARDEYGYIIEVVYGYNFSKKENVFGDFIDKYYDIKSGSNTDYSINRATAKLILNSAFGRTGLKIDDLKTETVSSTNSLEIQLKYNVINLIQITDKIDWIKYRLRINQSYLDVLNDDGNNKDLSLLKLKENDSSNDMQQCLPIAIFTTAYSCIRLFKAIKIIESLGGIIYAVDTDSIHTNIELPKELIGNELGLWKHEFKGTLGLYPLPKLYYVEGYKVLNSGSLSDFTEIKKAKGVSNNSITKDEYLNLVKGIDIIKHEDRFKINRSDSNVSMSNVKINIHSKLKKRIQCGVSTKPIVVKDNKIV